MLGDLQRALAARAAGEPVSPLVWCDDGSLQIVQAETVALAARWVAEPLGHVLPMGDASAEWRFAAGFVLVFIAVAFAGGMLAWAVRGAARALGMRPVDRLLGAVFGVLRGALLLLVLAAAIQLAGQGGEPWWRESASGPWLNQALAQLRPILPPALGQYLST